MVNEEENEKHSDMEGSPEPVFEMNPFSDYLRFIEEGNGIENTGTTIFHPSRHSDGEIAGEFDHDGMLSSTEQDEVLKKQKEDDDVQQEGTKQDEDEDEDEDERVEG